MSERLPKGWTRTWNGSAHDDGHEVQHWGACWWLHMPAGYAVPLDAVELEDAIVEADDMTRRAIAAEKGEG